MHDHGKLVPPKEKEGGEFSLLIACVQAAKKYNDEYMTQVIQKEKQKEANKKQKKKYS